MKGWRREKKEVFLEQAETMLSIHGFSHLRSSALSRNRGEFTDVVVPIVLAVPDQPALAVDLMCRIRHRGFEEATRPNAVQGTLVKESEDGELGKVGEGLRMPMLSFPASDMLPVPKELYVYQESPINNIVEKADRLVSAALGVFDSLPDLKDLIEIYRTRRYNGVDAALWVGGTSSKAALDVWEGRKPLAEYEKELNDPEFTYLSREVSSEEEFFQFVDDLKKRNRKRNDVDCENV